MGKLRLSLVRMDVVRQSNVWKTLRSRETEADLPSSLSERKLYV